MFNTFSKNGGDISGTYLASVAKGRAKLVKQRRQGQCTKSHLLRFEQQGFGGAPSDEYATPGTSTLESGLPRWAERDPRSKRSCVADSILGGLFNGPDDREGWGQPTNAPCQTSNNSTEHNVCEWEPGHAEVVMGAAHKTCHSNWSGLQGCQRVRSLERQRHFSLAPSQRRGAYSCACPSGFVSVAEDDNPHGRIEMSSVASIGNHASRKT